MLPDCVTIIVVVPVFPIVTFPFPSTVATSVLELA